jgi:hypothetical protein
MPTNIAADDSPGTVPANGKSYTLDLFNYWRLEDVQWLTATPHGQFQIPMPTNTPGEWRMDLIIQDVRERVYAMDSRSFLVSETPALLVRSNRRFANPTQETTVSCPQRQVDRVHARAQWA